MFGGPEVSYHQTYLARDWLSIIRTPYPTQNLQRKHRRSCNSGDGTDQRLQSLMFMMIMMMNITMNLAIQQVLYRIGIKISHI